MWKCKKCNEEIEDQFEICWNCSHDKSGNSVLNKSEDKEINVYESLENQRKTQPKVIKQANEYGIAGFVFSSILMVHEGFLISLEQARFNNMGNIKETIPVILLPLILFSTSIISSIKGCLKDEQLYQKGLAKVGLLFNIIIFIVMIFTIVQSAEGVEGGREVDDLQGSGLTLH